MKYYKLLNADGTPSNGGRGKYSLPDGRRKGEWMPKIENIELCLRGYHVVEFDHILDWRGKLLCRAEIRGKTIAAEGKIVAQEIRLVSIVKGWNEKNLRLFAADCAEHVLSIFEKHCPNDGRPRQAIEAARKFAVGKASQKELSVARAAVWDATWAAGRDAVWHAARAAAWGTAQYAARDAARAAARAAAWHAAWAAGRDAVWHAARAAGRDAEQKWQTKQLRKYLKEKS